MFVNFNILNQMGSPAINSNTFANRPAAGQTGRLFVSTDTYEIYRDNGTGWDLIGGPGSSTVTGSGATGQVTYWTGSNTVSGENNLFWDAAQNHLGINTATPGVALDVHSAADVALQLNGTGATPSILQQFLSAGVAQYEMGYNWNASADYRRFSIYDSQGSKEVISIDQQSRYVGINYQYSSLSDQPAYTLDVSGSGRFTDSAFFVTNGTGQTLIGTNTTANLGILEIVAPSSANAISLRGRTSDNTATINFNSNDGLTQYGFLSSNASNTSLAASGATRPLVFFTNSTERARIDDSGNLLVSSGTNTSAGFGPLQIGNTTAIDTTLQMLSSSTDDCKIHFGDSLTGNARFSGYILYEHALNYLSFGTNSVEAARFDTNGNFQINTTSTTTAKLYVGGAVGVGVLSPTSTLHVTDYLGGNLFKFVSGATTLEYFVSGSNPTFGMATNHDLRLMTNNATRATLTSGGNFLINTSTDTGHILQANSTSGARIGNPVTNATYGGFSFFTLFVTPATATNLIAVPAANWAGIIEVSWVSSADSNRAGAALIRWAYDIPTATTGPVFTVYNDNQNAVATFDFNAGNCRITITGGGANYYVQVRVQGSQAV